ncbi:DNA translocase FtsK [Oceanobacillus picturae]|uniref:DNA translocase FtsK n=1 Tax=Oceanobacillus picturae TaxID=171693 RepID=W9B9A7_9BACI|nr:FtsK/SpoIIIE domain-containing protein [Oceanobacillus picturae]CDO03080.1 DNA translocase FtsK [Oceanobacillus picturae]
MDLLIGGGLAAFTIYAAAKWQKSDQDKIQHTFKNIGYLVKDKTPKLFKTTRSDTYMLYTYHVPFGLVDDPKLQVLEKVLNKPVKISFVNTKLHIKVFNQQLPKLIDYDWKPTERWNIPIGKSYNGSILHDFDKIPHMTIAGMTRQGKTVLLKLIFAHLILNNPDDVEFYIIDLKGGLEFGEYENMKQVKFVASDVDEAEQCLSSVMDKVKEDMRYFKAKGYRNIVDTKIKRRRFVIVDEGAQLTPSKHHTKEQRKKFDYCQYTLGEISRISGALGTRLIFGNQYPTVDNLPREVKQNSDAKISFRLPTEIASRVAIDEHGAEKLNNAGRAIYRTHEKHIMQVPYIDDKDISERLGVYNVSSASPETTSRREDTVEFG